MQQSQRRVRKKTAFVSLNTCHSACNTQRHLQIYRKEGEWGRKRLDTYVSLSQLDEMNINTGRSMRRKLQPLSKKKMSMFTFVHSNFCITVAIIPMEVGDYHQRTKFSTTESQRVRKYNSQSHTTVNLPHFCKNKSVSTVSPLLADRFSYCTN